MSFSLFVRWLFYLVKCGAREIVTYVPICTPLFIATPSYGRRLTHWGRAFLFGRPGPRPGPPPRRAHDPSSLILAGGGFLQLGQLSEELVPRAGGAERQVDHAHAGGESRRGRQGPARAAQLGVHAAQARPHGGQQGPGRGQRG